MTLKKSSTEPTTGTSQPAKIGVIIGSQRKPRAGPQIASWVLRILEEYQDTRSKDSRRPYSLSLIDLNDYHLPLFDEPGLPSQIKSRDEYLHEHTKIWSKFIGSFDGFVFITPQYNWGYPASLKNAIDYLYHEWRGKPALVVSYGGHGGDKAGAQLQGVLNGMGIKVVERAPPLAFPDRDFTLRAIRGEDLGLSGEGGRKVWLNEREDINTAWAAFLVELNGPGV